MARSSPRLLREFTGGRKGFYRNAAVWFSGTGEPLRGRRGSAFGFVAVRHGATLVVAPGVPFERRNPRTRKFEAVETGG